MLLEYIIHNNEMDISIPFDMDSLVVSVFFFSLSKISTGIRKSLGVIGFIRGSVVLIGPEVVLVYSRRSWTEVSGPDLGLLFLVKIRLQVPRQISPRNTLTLCPSVFVTTKSRAPYLMMCLGPVLDFSHPTVKG